jgi:hypothetical protein
LRKLWVLSAALVLPCVAHADGAFPDSVGLLLPQDRPSQLVVSSNFGLVWSDDNGASWSYVCEPAMSAPYGFLYEVSRAPTDSFFAESLNGLTYAQDDGCTWTDSGFPQTGTVAEDAFPDPNDATHVIASANWNNGSVVSVFESHDGAASFGQPLFSTDAGTNIVGVEISRSAPGTYYAATLHASIVTGFTPGLARTTNGGANWQTVDLTSSVGQQTARIAAVDPNNADLVYLRVVNATDPTQGALVAATGGGTSVSTLFDAGIDAFFRRSDGALFLSSQGITYISTDQGAHFNPWGDHRQIRAFGERDGGFYVLTNCSALAVTWDQGNSWTPLLLGFDQISGPRSCGNVPNLCASDWNAVHPRIANRVPCTDGVVFISDGGSTSSPDSGTTGGPDGGGGGDGGPGGSTGGCGCAQSPGFLWLALLLGLVLLRAVAPRGRPSAGAL